MNATTSPAPAAKQFRCALDVINNMKLVERLTGTLPRNIYCVSGRAQDEKWQRSIRCAMTGKQHRLAKLVDQLLEDHSSLEIRAMVESDRKNMSVLMHQLLRGDGPFDQDVLAKLIAGPSAKR